MDLVRDAKGSSVSQEIDNSKGGRFSLE